MSGSQGWKILKNVLCASVISFLLTNQSPVIMLAIKRGKGGDFCGKKARRKKKEQKEDENERDNE